MIVHRLNRLGGGFGQNSATANPSQKSFGNYSKGNKRKAKEQTDQLASIVPPKRTKKPSAKKPRKIAKKTRAKKGKKTKKASYTQKKKPSKKLKNRKTAKKLKKKRSKTKVSYGSVFG